MPQLWGTPRTPEELKHGSTQPWPHKYAVHACDTHVSRTYAILAHGSRLGAKAKPSGADHCHFSTPQAEPNTCAAWPMLISTGTAFGFLNLGLLGGVWRFCVHDMPMPPLMGLLLHKYFQSSEFGLMEILE